MTDALNLLRNYVKAKKDFTEDDEKIIFGDVCYAKNVKTTYMIYGTGKDGKPKDYYTLECLAFLIKNRDLQHPLYVKNAGTRNISVVSRPDRRDLLSYLDGEIETTSSIDKNAPLEIAMQRPQPYVKASLITGASSGIASVPLSNAQLSSSAMNNQNSSTLPLLNASQAASVLNISGKRIYDSDEHLMHSSNKKMVLDSSSEHHHQISGDKSGSSSIQTGIASAKEEIFGRIVKKFDETHAQSTRSITENIMPLSEELSVEKIAAIKAKKKAQQRKQVSSGVDLIEDDLLGPTAGSQSTSINAATTSRSTNADEFQRNRINMDYSNLGNSGVGTGIPSMNDETNAVMMEIALRESVSRTRISVLQSSGKQFEKDINAFLQLMKAKEDGTTESNQIPSQNMASLSQNGSQPSNGAMQQSQSSIQAQRSRALGYNRFDQERYGPKDETGGFSIDTKLTYQPNGGTISLTPNPNAPSQVDKSNGSLSKNGSSNQTSTQLTQQKTNIMDSQAMKYSSQSRIVAPLSQQKTRKSPIIIIPNTATSLISMLNVLDLLQDLKYVSTEEKRKMLQNQNAPKDCEIIMHRREDGKNQQFKVVDNINKIAQQDWDRVVAVFAQGQQWQFKGWPFGSTNPPNPADIFSKVKGFHLKMSGHPIDPNIAKWSVTVVELDPHKRHLDRARLLTLWDELDRFAMKAKPYLFG